MKNNGESASNAVNRLFDLYADDIYRFVRFSMGNASEAEDVVQDVFLQALRSWGSFRGASSEKTWLWSIARHRILDWYRGRGRETTLGESVDGLEGSGPLEATGQDSDGLIDLERNLRRLPLEQRQVLVLRVVQDKSAAETAAILGWSNVKVRVTLYRALKAFEGLLQRDGFFREREGGSRGGQGLEKGLGASVRSDNADRNQGQDSASAGKRGRVWGGQPG